MRKFLFLDIDGVICIENALSKSCVSNVKKVLELVPNLEVVLTSTRRADENQCTQLSKILGVSYLYKTPVLHKGNRSVEITEFLSTIEEPYKFVIVDDDINLYTYYFNELLICNKYFGFTDEMVYAVLHILNGSSNFSS